MLDFFSNISEYLSLAWEWFSSFMTSSFTFFETVREAVGIPTLLIGWMPDLIGACIGSVVAVAVVKAIFGR